MLSLFCLYLACFSNLSVNITKCHSLIKTADMIMPHIFRGCNAVQSISGWQDEKGACNDFIHGE